MLSGHRQRVALLTVLAVAACSPAPDRESGGGSGEPLFDLLPPDVLVESERLSLPPALDGNRFLSGWVPWEHQGRLTLVGQAGRPGRLELVDLGEGRGERTLILDLEALPPDSEAQVAVHVAGREIGPLAVSDPLPIPLPDGLDPGRVTIELDWRGDPLVVADARVRPALPAGEVRLENGELEQSGWSLVTLARRRAGATHLEGIFVPPRKPTPEQSFVLHLVGEEGETEVFRWPADGGSRRGEARFRLPLPTSGSVFSVRLLARGVGPAAAWRRLRLVGRAAGLPPPPAPAPPRRRLVLLYVFDALRADAVGHLGAGAGATPTLDRLAAEGATFRSHGAVAPNTLPSTKALLTGRTWIERGGWKLPPEEPPTVAERFRAAGWRTALVSANGYVGPAYGTARGFEETVEVVFDEAKSPINRTAEQVHAAALAWLDGLADGESAFLYLHSLNPHNPYTPPSPWGESASTPGSTIDGASATLIDVKQGRIELSTADRERLKRLYAAGVAYSDAELGRFVAELGDRFGERELFVLVTSDHGEELFDHGGVLHGYTLYAEQLRVPLVVWAPGLVVPGIEISRLTDTLDLHATFEELAGNDRSGTGDSLLPLLLAGRGEAAGETSGLRFAAASSLDGPLVSVRSQRFKVVLAPRTGNAWGMGQSLGRGHDPEYVFDLARDPAELDNLAGTDHLEVAYLRSSLLAWMRVGLEVDSEEAPEEVDPEVRRRLRALGYLE